MTEIKLRVYRMLDDRELPYGSQEQVELEWRRHKERRKALEELIAESPDFRVLDWGDTKDESRPHEVVDIAIEALKQVLTYAVVPGLVWLGRKLAETAVEQGVTEAVKALVARLRPHQEAHRVLDFTIRTPDGTTIAVDPPDRFGTITVQFADGAVDSIKYTRGDGEAGGV